MLNPLNTIFEEAKASFIREHGKETQYGQYIDLAKLDFLEAAHRVSLKPEAATRQQEFYAGAKIMAALLIRKYCLKWERA